MQFIHLCLKNSFNVSKQASLYSMFVSSANNMIETNLPQYWIFIYKRNSKGPNTNPCGTPLVIVISSDLTPLYFTNCFLLHR